ncbi:SDR family NAD(P)-dependent oxidoreductase [Yinghuangia soli]|uniref:SDR family oxidoreductase n=1 Tax=Yinghuangia soli TaxID=2908204 RepID=A0AA41PYF0_9ACTN|nr:SDR family NAD(P)-dependent oxidoreductase [Yinghuangia soli]MCF2528214.1 SDR family oxidoreductase [Yinghuangia soli]
MERFQDKRIIVTGGGSGIGQATVLRLLREAGSVHAVDVNAEGLEKTRAMAKEAGVDAKLSTGVLDVANEAAVAESVGETVERLGGLDVLVNAAGILRAGHTHSFSLDVWNQVININLTGTFLMTRAALPALLETGEGAVIVNFSSTSAAFAHPYMAAYAASKGGIDAFTHAIALEYSRQGLRALCVAPGSISSGIVDDTPNQVPADAEWELFGKLMPLIGEGMAHPDVIAGMIAALASEDGKFVTGTTLRIDGGTHA